MACRPKTQMIQYHFIMTPSIGFCLVPHQPHPGDTCKDFFVSQEASSTMDSSAFFYLWSPLLCARYWHIRDFLLQELTSFLDLSSFSLYTSLLSPKWQPLSAGSVVSYLFLGSLFSKLRNVLFLMKGFIAT